MFKRILFLTANLIALFSEAQNVAINNDGAVPDQSAILDVNSNNKGILAPRLTAIQKSTIASPAKGLLIYQTENPEGFYYNAGTPAAPNWILLGATGPQGTQGLPGPAGATGILQSYYVAGTAPYPNSVDNFISPTISITIVQGQHVYLSASRALGGYAAVSGLCIYPAYQLIGTPGITRLGLGICGLQVPASTRTTFSINGVFSNLPAGTYKFGMSGFTNGAQWTNSEWGYVTALVF